MLESQKRKGLLHRIVIGDERLIHYDNPNLKKSWSKPYIHISGEIKSSWSSWSVFSGIRWDQLGAVLVAKTHEGPLSTTVDVFVLDYKQRHDIMILQHDNAPESHILQTKTTWKY